MQIGRQGQGWWQAWPRCFHGLQNGKTFEDKLIWNSLRRATPLEKLDLRLWIGLQQILGRTCGLQLITKQ